MSLDQLGARFKAVQNLQDQLLGRVREFKRTGDPNALPDPKDTEKLDKELENLVKTLGDSDEESSVASEPPTTKSIPSGSTSTETVADRPGNKPVPIEVPVRTSIRRSRSSLRAYEMSSSEPLSGRATPPDITWSASRSSSRSVTPDVRPAEIVIPNISPRRQRKSRPDPVVVAQEPEPLEIDITVMKQPEVPVEAAPPARTEVIPKQSNPEVVKPQVAAPQIAAPTDSRPTTFGAVMKQVIANSSLDLDPSVHESEMSGEPALDLSLDSLVDSKQVMAVSPPPAIVTEIPVLEPRLASPGRQRKLNPVPVVAAPLSPEKPVLESPKSPAKWSSSGLFVVNKQPPLSPTDELLYVSPTPPASPPPVVAPEYPSRKKVSTELSTALADKIAAVVPVVKSSEKKAKKKEKSEPIKMDLPPAVPRVIEAEPAPVTTPTVVLPSTPPRAQPVPKQQVIFMSPLLKSNERKREQTDPKRYWSKVREQRLAIDSVLDMLKQVKDLNTAVAADFDTVRVRQYGVTGEYLFKQNSEVQEKIEQELDDFRTEQMIQKIETRKKPPKRTPSNVSNYTVSSGTSYKDQKAAASVQSSRRPSRDEQVSEPALKRASSALPPQPQPLPSIRMSELLHATYVIQHWFREWRKRRSLRLYNMASMAESEAVDARAALRKRRQERRGRDASPVIISSLIETAGPSTADWIRSLITPVAQQVDTMPEAN